MQTMTTLEKVCSQAFSLSKDCHDATVPVWGISFDNINQVKIDGQPHPLRIVAQRQICNRLGIPHPYLVKCPEDLQAMNLNHWISQERNEELFFRFDGDQVRAIFTKRYQPVDNMQVLERLSSLGFGPDTQVQAALDSEFMSLSIPDAKKTFRVDGDKMTPGISIANSEVGLSSLSIACFVLRLVCTNGMISKTEVTASYRHTSLKVMEEFPAVLQNVGAEIELQRAKFRLSLESPVANPESTIESFNRQFQLREQETTAVEWAWPQEMASPATMFNVVNTYTKASQYPNLPAESSHRLQRTGGAILSMVG